MRVFVSLIKQIHTWDKVSQSALALAVILLVLAVYTLATLPNLRMQSGIGAVGLLLVIQAIVMWGNRNLIEPYSAAQQAFLAGDFHKVTTTLETWFNDLEAQGKTVTVESLTLLANAYRNLGEFEKSNAALTSAFDMDEASFIANYAWAKNHLVTGYYADAVTFFKETLRYGKSDAVQFDLAHALYRLGETQESLKIFKALPSQNERYRQLFIAYILQQLDQAPAPSPDLVQAGLPFWEAELERFHMTPYGQDLQADVQALQNLL